MSAATVITPNFASRNAYETAGDVAVALQPDEALFCFSATELKSRAQQFLSLFPGLVTYAVKCNSSREVLATLAETGINTWDVASVHEMAAVHAVQPKARFHYHNPVKSRREISDAYGTYGCRRFVVDCREELQKIHEVIGPDATVEIAGAPCAAARPRFLGP